MASKTMDDAERIARMTEWNEHEPWEYSDNDEHNEENTLAAAKRFLAAQSFLLSWQEGKVPTGWRRARRLGDFDGDYPRSVVDAAEEIIADRIALHNYERTERVKSAISTRAKNQEKRESGEKDLEELNRLELEKLKADMSKFSHEFFQAKSALTKTTSAMADITFRIQALSENLK